MYTACNVVYGDLSLVVECTKISISVKVIGSDRHLRCCYAFHVCGDLARKPQRGEIY